ncbi:Structural maintenance of chromosomes protein 5 [Yarrowia sp. B02]|nr:Structural maintenance of chromosomes protein 5 [Yarrowia sp. B02]
MAKRDLPNGSQVAAKRMRRDEEEDDEQRSYNQEIRDDDEQHGSSMIPRPDLSVCEKTGYRPGSILQIYMKNVMSYDECVVNFGPTLNFVIGPNGSGKSTMLAAICLAFAAPINCMGKASLKAQQLIKATKAELEVRVKVKNLDGKRDLTFKRTLARDEAQGKFYINGEKSNAKEVRKRARELDIQISSMTRFLPQDRVKDFTTMSPKDLLITTMEDVGYANMRSHYDSLVKQQENSADDEQQLKLATDKLADLMRRREGLSGQIAQLEEREKQEEQVKKLQGVASYVKGLSLQQACDRLATEIDELKANYRALGAERDELNESKSIHEKKHAHATQSLNARSAKADEYWRKYRQLQKKEQDISTRMAQYEGELEAAQKRLDQHERHAADLQQKVKAEQQKYTELCAQIDDPAFQAKAKQLHDQRKEYQQQFEDAKNAKRTLDNRFRESRTKADELHSKLDNERRKNSTFQPVLRINANLIEKVKAIAPPSTYNYSLPAINTVRLKRDSVEDQRMISAVVKNVAQQFVARDSASSAQMVGVADIISVREINKSLLEASHNVPANRVQLRELGFDGYLLDLIEGPDHNLAHLCEAARLHQIPYSRQGLTPEQIAKVPASMSRFISKNMLYTVKKSRYGNQYTSTNQIIYEKVPDRTLEKDLQAQYDKLAARLKPINEEVRTADSVLKDKQHLLSETTSSLREHRRAESSKPIFLKNLQHAKAKLKDHTESPPETMDAVKARIEKDRSKVRDEVAATLLQRVQRIQKLSKIIPLGQKESVELAQASALKESTKIRLMEVEQERGQFKTRARRLMERHEAAKAEYQEYMETQGGTVDEETVAFVEQLKEQYDGPHLIEHVEAQIATLHQELTYANVDMDARTKFEEVTQEAERTQKQVDHYTSKRDNAAEEMQKTIDTFVPRLKEMVGTISSRFYELLKVKEGASGQVQLRTTKEKADPNDPAPEEPLPFSAWGIEIMCSFRTGATMCKLDGTTQSGGERSISIGTYLLALQSVAPVAFRALDEINQALDAKNEVIMNQHVADTAFKEHQQLFLLSPKLIRFNYPKGMRILTICNGSGVTTKGPSGGSFLSLKHLLDVFRE